MLLINKKKDLEIDILTAVEIVDNEINNNNRYNNRFIRQTFDLLSDEKVISEGTFWKWKKSSDQDSEDHTKSIRRLKDFFTKDAQTQRNQRKQGLNQEATNQMNSKTDRKLSRKEKRQLNKNQKDAAGQSSSSSNEKKQKEDDHLIILEEKLIQIFKKFDEVTPEIMIYENLKVYISKFNYFK